MGIPIIDLNTFVTNNAWLRRLRIEPFGIILPDGWFGRPYDNQHYLKAVSATNNTLKIVFDDVQEIEIVNPTQFEIHRVDPNWSSLKLTGCNEITFTWVPYGEENSGKKTIKHYQSGNDCALEIVGYFPAVP